MSGLFIGCLSFTKPEGMVASLLILAILITYYIFDLVKSKKALMEHIKQSPITTVLVFALIAFIPTVIFQTLHSPGNLTFVNGLISKDNPISFLRAKMILAFLFFELKSSKWGWIWMLLVVGMFLKIKGCFKKQIAVVPAFLFSYMAIILFYYLINTHFEIKWWLQVSMHRILFSILPITIFWIFSATLQNNKKSE